MIGVSVVGNLNIPSVIHWMSMKIEKLLKGPDLEVRLSGIPLIMSYSLTFADASLIGWRRSYVSITKLASSHSKNNTRNIPHSSLYKVWIHSLEGAAVRTLGRVLHIL